MFHWNPHDSVFLLKTLLNLHLLGRFLEVNKLNEFQLFYHHQRGYVIDLISLYVCQQDQEQTTCQIFSELGIFTKLAKKEPITNLYGTQLMGKDHYFCSIIPPSVLPSS